MLFVAEKIAQTHQDKANEISHQITLEWRKSLSIETEKKQTRCDNLKGFCVSSYF